MGTTTLAVDIGGTKVAVGLLDDTLTIVDRTHYASQRGIDGLRQVMNAAIRWADHRHSAIAIATPGKLVGTRHSTIAPGTADNLGTFRGEFDGFDWITAIADWCPGSTTAGGVTVINDALAQLVGGWIQIGAPSDGIFAYLGPGTGLGGGFWDSDSHHFIGDGHIFDILLDPMDPDPTSIPPIHNGRSHPRTTLMAEDIISGRGFAQRFGMSSHIAFTTNPLDPRFIEMGRYAAQLIHGISHRHVKKKALDTAWPDAVVDQLSQTRHWLIGGSIGPAILSPLVAQLKAFNSDVSVQLIESPTTAALKGVVYASTFR